MGTTAKIVSFGSKHEEIPPVPLPPVQLERSKRRGSVLRREALERLQQGKGGSLGDKDDGGLPGGGRRGVPSAWTEEEPLAGQQEQQQQQQRRQRQRRRRSSKATVVHDKPFLEDDTAVLVSPSIVSTMPDLYADNVFSKEQGASGAAAAPATPAECQTVAEGSKNDGGLKEDTNQREGNKRERRITRRRRSTVGVQVRPADDTNSDGGVKEDMGQRAGAARERRINRRRRHSVRVNELERVSVKNVGDTFRKLYVPPLGPLDDPPGVIYLDGTLTEKTVDVRVLDSVGEGVRETRNELFGLTSRRRSLVEEIRAQNRRVSRGFPRNVVAESILENRVREDDTKREKAESKLQRLLDHRNRLFAVLKASHADDDKDVKMASKIVRSEAPQGDTGINGMDIAGGSGAASRPRRSSLDNLTDLTKELMAREPSPTGRDVATVNCSRRPSVKTIRAVQEALTWKQQKRQLDQGWREVMEAVFSEEAERRRQVVCFREQIDEDDREEKESNIRRFMEATTPKEHVEFLITAMDPAKVKDLASVIKCLLLHYTGPAADELDILLGGRLGGTGAQELLEISLHVLDEVHIQQVPPILMLQWLLSRAPHLCSLLLKGGVIGRAFHRLEGAESKGFESGERATQYAALFLVVGLMFA